MPEDENESGSATGKEAKEEKHKPMESFAHTIPQIRECRSWDEFKNHHGSDEHCHAIETLIAGDALKAEIEDAAFMYERFRNTHTRGSRGGGRYSRRNIGQFKTVVSDGDDVKLQQLRINSSIIMSHLGSQSPAGKKWKDRPHVFRRPFRYLIYFHDNMKEILAEMEEAAAATGVRTQTEQPPEGMKSKDEKDGLENDTLGIKELFDKVDAAALEDMRLYIKFMDKQVMPEYERYQRDEGPLPSKISWDSIWYLFKPGDLVYIPKLNGDVRKRIPMGWGDVFRTFQREFGDQDVLQSTSFTNHASQVFHTDQMIWRVHQPPHLDLPVEGCPCTDCLEKEATLKIPCYYIDFDGQTFCPVEKVIKIMAFEGERDIIQLPCYPIRYVQDKDTIIATARDSGAKFLRHLDPARRYNIYRGWTLVRTPLGGELEFGDSKTLTSPEHIESEILIDFEEAFNKEPYWKPDRLTADVMTHRAVVAVDNANPLREWHDSQRSKLKETWEDKVIMDDGINILQTNKYVETDPLLNRKTNAQIDKLEGEDLALLPKRLFAYALWERKFVPVDVRDVQFPDMKDKDKAFDSLQISEQHKSLIESLVYSHFMKRMEESTVEIATQDLIRGKGKGIVILLFGVPGVGKTATAEAVAQKFGKPLFPITCGDLGFTPERVEQSLSEIFRLAHLWDCVLLLDEADVFITQRDRKDLERNALVSVFLRMLEYYNGILFLTTNRPGVLDEAVKSRVHLNLHYNSLTEEQLIAIFKLNIRRLEEIEDQASKAPHHKKLYIDEGDIIDFARQHFRGHSVDIGRWNGRQIRNAFLIAASLAHYEGDQGKRPEGLQKQLTSKHFKRVEETTKLYDEYRVQTLGVTDSSMAHDRFERDDSFGPFAAAPASSNPQHSYSQPPGPGGLARQGSMSWEQPRQHSMGTTAIPMHGNGRWPGNPAPHQQQGQYHPAMQQYPGQEQKQEEHMLNYGAGISHNTSMGQRQY